MVESTSVANPLLKIPLRNKSIRAMKSVEDDEDSQSQASEQQSTVSCGQSSSTKSRSKSSDTEIRNLKVAARTAAKRAREAEKRLQRIQQVSNAEVNKLNAKIRLLEKTVSATAGRAQSLEAQVEAHETELNDVQDEAIAALKRMASEKHSVAEALEQSKLQIGQLLNNATHGKADGKWNPPPDEEVRNRLQSLHNDVRDWAKKWAPEVLQFDPHVSAATSEFGAYLSRFVTCDARGHFPPPIVQARGKLKEKIPMLLLNAALTDRIQSAFFHNPFFCVPIYASSLQEIYNESLKANQRDAHQWRCLLWRLMNPRLSGGSNDELESVCDGTAKRVRGYCDHIDSSFRKGVGSLLIRTLSSEEDRKLRGRELREILMTAASIAKSLWTQSSYLISMGLGIMQQRKVEFSTSSPFMQGHPLSRVDVDDPDVHDGRKVLIVTRPALMAFEGDDRDGIDGEGYRVLAKAIVLLEDVAS